MSGNQQNQRRNAAPQAPASPKVIITLKKNEVIDNVKNEVKVTAMGVVAEGNKTVHNLKVVIYDEAGNKKGTKNTSAVGSDGTFHFEETYPMTDKMQTIVRIFKIVGHNIEERMETIVPAITVIPVPVNPMPAKPLPKRLKLWLHDDGEGNIVVNIRTTDSNNVGLKCKVALNFMDQYYPVETDDEGLVTLQLPYIPEGTDEELVAITSGILEEVENIRIYRPVAADCRRRGVRNLILLAMCAILWIGCFVIGSGDALIHVANQPTDATWEHSRWAIAAIFSIIVFCILCVPSPRRAPLERHIIPGGCSSANPGNN